MGLVDVDVQHWCDGAPAPARTRTFSRATLFFDLSLPQTYLAAEQAERLFGQLRWIPACSTVLDPARQAAAADPDVRARARRLRVPLVWAGGPPQPVPGAMRAAALATERGCGGAFVLAAARLAFCGDFDLEEPEALAEAGAAAGLEADAVLEAAADERRDDVIAVTGRTLRAAGADRLPVLAIGGTLYCGEEQLALVAAMAA